MNTIRSLSYMQERLGELYTREDMEWLVGMPSLPDCYEYDEASYEATIAKHQQERSPCVIRACFEAPGAEEAHKGLTQRLERDFVLGRDHLEPMFWIDEIDRVTPLHYDNFDNQMFVASGTKVFVFYSPREHRSLYHPWSRLGRGRQSQLDAANPDFERFPLYRHAKPHVAVVRAGDMLYIPADWSHQVFTIDCEVSRGIGINYWYPVTLRELWRKPSEKLSFAMWTSVANVAVRAKRALTGKRMAVPEPVEVMYSLTQEDREAAKRYEKNLNNYLDELDNTPARKEIVRQDVLAYEELSAELIETLYQVLCRVFRGYTKDYFVQHILHRAGETTVTVLYGENDEVAGFIAYGVEQHLIKGRTHAIFDGGVVVDLDYRGGGKELAMTAFQFALRYKLQHPTHELGAFLKVTTPALYRLLAASGPVFPHPEQTTPPAVKSLIEILAKRRGYERDEENPWLLPAPKKVDFLRDKCFTKRKECPYESFFLSHAPHFLDGDIMLVYMPLDFASMTQSLLKTSKKMLLNKAS